MASTTQTTNYGLPLYQSSDRPAWTDTNTPFELLDTAVKTASDNASSAADAVSILTSALATLNQTVSGHTTELSELTNAVASAATAQGTSFTAYGLNTATDAQTAIQNAATAAINSYDNTNSGLTATNVQAAIDEVITTIPDVEEIVNESGIQAYKYGKVVTVAVSANSDSNSIISSTALASYPPVVNSSVIGNYGGSSSYCRIQLNTTGILYALEPNGTALGAQSTVTGTLTYITV